MNSELYERLHAITEEEKHLLEGSNLERSLYAGESSSLFTVDCSRLLSRGLQIEVRPHTRFVHFPRHSHNYVEMVYMYSGSTTHIINDTDRLTLRQGDLLFLNQSATQEIEAAGMDDLAVNFIIMPAFFDKTLSMLEGDSLIRDFLVSCLDPGGSTPGYLLFRAGDILPVCNLLENMIWTLFRTDISGDAINRTTMGLIMMNLSCFAGSIGQSQGSSRDLVLSVLRYIDAEYPTASLARISERLELPAYTLSRLLKKHTGRNFKELLQECRLRRAAELLADTDMSIEAVLTLIGYDNSSYFYRSFDTRYGMTPAAYRRTHSRT